MRGIPKRLKTIIRRAEDQGWTVTRTKKGHIQFKPPHKDGLVHHSTSPSDHRSEKNLLTQLKHLGYEP